MSYIREYVKQVEEAAGFLKKTAGDAPEIAVVLGSGLGKFADSLQNSVIINYPEIPGWPMSTAPGHRGRLVIGECNGVRIAVMQGRVHYYEGYGMQVVTFPTRALARWGVKKLILTNASGGVDLGYLPGDLVLIYDHVNLMGSNPLIGENVEEWGPRFSDMTYGYDVAMMETAEKAASQKGIILRRGVYVAFSGPSFETPAEIRMARTIGGQVVGMSTAPECIVANHMGLRVLAISCVSNYASGITSEKLTHEEVLEKMGQVADKLTDLLQGIIPLL